MEASLRILMEGLIDYAGLFPPASLDMSAAVRNYAAYRAGPQARWLGRFVVPVSRLGEFQEAVAGLPPARGGWEAPWRLSALGASNASSGGGAARDPAAGLKADLEADLEAVADFNRAGAAGPRPVVIDSIELKAASEEDVRGAMVAMPAGLTPYFEVTPGDDPAPLIAAVARAGGRAKVRTGGVTASLFPSPEALARFLAACARAGVAFKATAGLHHPVRSVRRLTYEPDSESAPMHGFLNVFLAAAFAADGMDEATLADLLREESPGAFSFRADGAEWRGHRIGTSRLREARRDFAIAFGSCSFEEPRQDLSEARLL